MISRKTEETFVLQENLRSITQKSLFFKLLLMSRPEWTMILLGCIVCVMIGATQTIFAILIAKVVNVSI